MYLLKKHVYRCQDTNELWGTRGEQCLMVSKQWKLVANGKAFICSCFHNNLKEAAKEHYSTPLQFLAQSVAVALASARSLRLQMFPRFGQTNRWDIVCYSPQRQLFTTFGKPHLPIFALHWLVCLRRWFKFF